MNMLLFYISEYVTFKDRKGHDIESNVSAPKGQDVCRESYPKACKSIKPNL